MTLNIKDAKQILEEAERLNPGPWIEHSRNVALAAKLIADKCPRLDAELSYIYGLLHDIGRHKYLNGMEHVLEGYNFMMEKGYEDVARICMTHSFPIKDVHAIYGKWNCNDSEIKTVEKYINSIQYNEYDKLIQLCDSLAVPKGFTLIEKRFVQTALRSGISSLTLCKWKAVLEIKKYFEDIIGCSIYELLPEVIENTFEMTN